MIDYPIIASILLIHFLAVISPGPDFFMAIKNSLTYSRKIGIFTSVGFGLGIGVHVFYSIAGVALLISKSIVIFSTIKYLGVAYLLYVGVKSLLAKPTYLQIEKQKHKKEITPIKAIFQGFITNVLNPKATLFFLSLFTLVITPETSTETITIVSLAMIVNTILWFTFVSIFLTQKRIRKAYNQYQGYFSKFFGGVLIALGLKIAFSK